MTLIPKLEGVKRTKKQELYYNLIKVIEPMVDLNYKNLIGIKEKCDEYIKSQTILKKVGKNTWGDDFLVYQIGIRSVELIIQNVQELVEKNLIDITSFQDFYNSIHEKLRHITDYIIVPASDVMLHGLLINRKKKLQECYYNINDWTRKKKRVLDLIKACLRLESLGLENEVVKNAHESLFNNLIEELGLEEVQTRSVSEFIKGLEKC